MKKIGLMLIAIASLSGCVSSIGKDDFTCQAEEKGGVCAGPRDIYELTNSLESLENLVTDEETKKPLKNYSFATKPPAPSSQNNDVTVYSPRTLAQQTPSQYEKATPIQQTRFESRGGDRFNTWPSNSEPLAPEPLAVLKPQKIMRVLISAWKDTSGNLNMPGFVYVEVEPKTWSYGETANLRPTRVVPLEIRKHSQEELNKRKQRSKGVSPLGVMTNTGGGQ